TYPGVFKMTKPTGMGIPGNPDYYKGKIIILVNENTISVGEFCTMIFMKAPKSKLLGTPTAGADGNVTYISFPDGTLVSVTGLGVYFPNGKETQRVGIQPDIIVKQTLSGYLNKKDEQLDKAIEYLSK
ncbi:MAG: S41 family peptidase, partial [Ginsengibacter sp.]